MKTLIMIATWALVTVTSQAYTMLNWSIDAKWASGNVPFYINLGQYDTQARSALADWSQYTGATHLNGIDVTSGSAWFNGRNDIAWSTNEGNLNYTWPSNILAICLPNFDWDTGAMIETDIVFNTAFTWSSFNGFGGYGYDINRVLLHEIGHSIGLGHSEDGNIMSAYYSYSVWQLSADDIAGANHLYGRQTVPESGTSVGLLTLALVGVVCMRRFA